VEEGEIGLLLPQRRNEVAECGNNGLADAPPVTVADTEQHGIANQPTIIRLVTAETEHSFGKNEADIVLQPLAQPVAPVIIAIGVARPSADPHRSVVAQLDHGGRDIVRPEIEGPAAGQIKAGMMPVAGQNPILYRAAVKRETEVRATVIERVDATLIVHDEHNPTLAAILSRLNPPATEKDMEAALAKNPADILPLPIGIFRNDRLPSLEERIDGQIADVKKKKGDGDLRKLLFAGDMWEVK